MTSEVAPPEGAYAGRHKVWAAGQAKRGWMHLCRSHPGPMRRCYADLADAPYPAVPTPRHHRLKGRLREFWEWEVGGGERVRYKAGSDGDPIIVYAGPAPPDTH